MEENSILCLSEEGENQNLSLQTLLEISIHNATESLLKLLEVPSQYRKLSHIQKIFFYIQKLPFFQKFTYTEDSSSICRNLQLVHYDKGKEIFHSNSKGDSMFSILKGSVLIFEENNNLENLSSPTKETVHELKLGDCFGEYCLFHETVRSVSVVAKENCSLMKLEKEAFIKFPNHLCKQCLQTPNEMMLFKFYTKFIPLQNVEIKKLQRIIDKKLPQNQIEIQEKLQKQENLKIELKKNKLLETKIKNLNSKSQFYSKAKYKQKIFKNPLNDQTCSPFLFDIEELGPFDSFGEGPFFGQKKSPFTIISFTKALLIQIEFKDLEQILEGIDFEIFAKTIKKRPSIKCFINQKFPIQFCKNQNGNNPNYLSYLKLRFHQMALLNSYYYKLLEFGEQNKQEKQLLSNQNQ